MLTARVEIGDLAIVVFEDEFRFSRVSTGTDLATVSIVEGLRSLEFITTAAEAAWTTYSQEEKD